MNYVCFLACTKTRSTGTLRNTGMLWNTGTPEQPKKPKTLDLAVLFCFPITDQVKNGMQCNLFTPGAFYPRNRKEFRSSR